MNAYPEKPKHVPLQLEIWKNLVDDWLNPQTTIAQLARKYSATETTLSRWIASADLPKKSVVSRGAAEVGEKSNKEGVYTSGDDNTMAITCKSSTIKTLQDALKAANVDLDVWEVERWVANKWDMGFKDEAAAKPGALELWQVKVWLRRKAAEVRALQDLIQELRTKTPKPPAIRRSGIPKSKPRRQLEIDIVDPHLGLQCYQAGSDQPYNIDIAENLCTWALQELLKRAEAFGPFEKIIWPFGNDYLHIDTPQGTTTAGTNQPEATSQHNMYMRGAMLGINMIETMRQVAPVKVIQVPGNHDRFSSYTLGVVMWARYNDNCKDVEVICDASPYKFHHFGVNLLGFDHGHSIAPIKLAVLMANECRTNGWADARYCEWHCGDQHRPGNSKPIMMEEQGVSVEYLTGITPANEWHKLKGFNWQKRGANAFIWDHDEGKVARLYVNIDSYTNEPLNGAK